MEIKMQIPFQELLSVVKTLTSKQKTLLRQELADAPKNKAKNGDFTQLLLNGPVFTESQIQAIQENTKSIAKWRTKS